MIYLEKKMLDCDTKLEQFRVTISNTVNEEKITKNIVQFLKVQLMKVYLINVPKKIKFSKVF